MLIVLLSRLIVGKTREFVRVAVKAAADIKHPLLQYFDKLRATSQEHEHQKDISVFS